jgi:hypothetical protein
MANVFISSVFMVNSFISKVTWPLEADNEMLRSAC